jgi:pyruvate/2-oxoglutarate dehydrogenase complex dihydrolipoamide dehydrogenase (E3) component
VIQVGDKVLKYKRACIATGARATIPPIEGIKESGYLTNSTLFNLTKLPTRFVVIGAGPIGNIH